MGDIQKAFQATEKLLATPRRNRGSHAVALAELNERIAELEEQLVERRRLHQSTCDEHNRVLQALHDEEDSHGETQRENDALREQRDSVERVLSLRGMRVELFEESNPRWICYRVGAQETHGGDTLWEALAKVDPERGE